MDQGRVDWEGERAEAVVLGQVTMEVVAELEL
jgi:hypothetical protein